MGRTYIAVDFYSKEITKKQFDETKKTISKVVNIKLSDGTPLKKALTVKYEDSKLHITAANIEDERFTGSYSDVDVFVNYIDNAVDDVELTGDITVTDDTSGAVDCYQLAGGEFQKKEFKNQDAFAEWQMEQSPDTE
jgi:hypothetical protein